MEMSNLNCKHNIIVFRIYNNEDVELLFRFLVTFAEGIIKIFDWTKRIEPGNIRKRHRR